MHLLKTNVNGNPNVGLYGIITNQHVLLGKEFPSQHDKEIEEIFGLSIKRLTIAGTSMLGVFCLWHDGKLLIPSITFDDEKAALDELQIPYVEIKTELTCLGNNVIIGKNKALINPDFTKQEQAQLEEALGMPCEQTTIMEIEAIGAVAVIRGEKGLFHRDIPPTTVKALEKELGIEISLGTINMGNPYIKSGLLLSEKGFLVGDASGGPEIRNADEALGFI